MSNLTDPTERFHVITLSGGGDSMLDVLCFEAEVGLRSIYLHVASLSIEEVDLNAARFERFSRYEQSCRVHLPETELGYLDRLDYNNRLIDWIALHTRRKWSFVVLYHSMNNVELEWSFEDAGDAIMFKLVWC